jgi:NarL family two-component system response regulator LiaR
MNLVRVLLVDDHQMLTEALRARLSTVPGLWVVGGCRTDDPNLPKVIGRLRPDVITVEVKPTTSATIALLGELRAAWSPARIVVLTGSHDQDQVVDVARFGVSAWTPKESPTAHLVAVLHGVSLGHAYFPPEHLGAVLSGLRADIQEAQDGVGPLNMLSDRELDVLLCMAEGHRGARIAAQLGVSTNTVRTHIRNIFSKLDVHSRLEAVSVARAAGIQRYGFTNGAQRGGGSRANEVLSLVPRREP